MKKSVVFGAVAAAAMLLTGCASDDGYGYGGYGYNVAADYGNPLFYDGFYGPFADGYWGPEGDFWYRGARERGFHRDFDHHFRRTAASGFHPAMGVHRAIGAGPAPAAHAAAVPPGVHLQS